MQNITYASIGRRALSFTIDDIVTSLFFIVVFYEQITAMQKPEDIIFFVQHNIIYLAIIKIIYHTFFIGFNGITLGKYFTKIKAIDENSGMPIGYNRAFLRAVVRSIGEMLFYITFIFAFIDLKKQTLQDKISNCVVINA